MYASISAREAQSMSSASLNVASCTNFFSSTVCCSVLARVGEEGFHKKRSSSVGIVTCQVLPSIRSDVEHVAYKKGTCMPCVCSSILISLKLKSQFV